MKWLKGKGISKNKFDVLQRMFEFVEIKLGLHLFG